MSRSPRRRVQGWSEHLRCSARHAAPIGRATRRLLWLLLGACAPHGTAPRAALPDDFFRQAEALAVRGDARQAPRQVRFGRYVTRKAWLGRPEHRQQEPNFSNGYVSVAALTQTAGFELANAHGALLTGHCTREAQELRDRELSLGQGEDGFGLGEHVVRAEFTSMYRCVVTLPGGERLRLGLLNGRRGRLESESSAYQLRALTGAEPGATARAEGTATYVIEQASGPLGAVDLGAAPKVVLRRDVSEHARDRLAASAMALLLLRDLHQQRSRPTGS